MQDTRESSRNTESTVWDVLRYLGDASYAMLPRDVAHKIGEVKKNFWGGVCWLIEKEVEWTEARVAGGDRLREEWRDIARRRATDETQRGSGI